MEIERIQVKNSRRRRRSAEISFGMLLLQIEGWIHYLLSKWSRILLIAVIGAAAGYIYGAIRKPVYIAATTFVLEDPEKIGGLSQYTGLASLFGLDLTKNEIGGIFQGDNVIELYKSNLMIERTLLGEVDGSNKNELLIDRYIKFNKLREKWAKNPELSGLKFSAIGGDSSNTRNTRLRDSILDLAITDINSNYLRVEKPDKRLNIIKAEVRAPDEIFAKNFDEKIVNNVNDFYVQTKTNRSLRNVQLLQRKTDSVRAIVNNANTQNHMPAIPGLNKSQLPDGGNRDILAELAKNLEMAKIGLQKEIPLLQIIDRPKFPLERSNLTPMLTALFGFLAFGILGVLYYWLKKLYLELRAAVV